MIGFSRDGGGWGSGETFGSLGAPLPHLGSKRGGVPRAPFTPNVSFGVFSAVWCCKVTPKDGTHVRQCRPLKDRFCMFRCLIWGSDGESVKACFPPFPVGVPFFLGGGWCDHSFSDVPVRLLASTEGALVAFLPPKP